MNIYEQLLNERNQLEDIIQKASKILSCAPQGSLRIVKSSKTYSYYHRARGLPANGVYLSKSKDEEAIKSLASKAYCRKILNVALKQQEAIDKFLVLYQENSIDDLTSQMNPGALRYITPFKLEGKESCKCTSEATTETVERSPEVDLARNLLSICEAFLKAKGCKP